MKINFTKKEYRSLLDIIHIADWIMNSHSIEERKDTEEYEEVFQKLLACAKEMGYEDLIEYIKRNGKYYPTHKFENESVAHQFIDEFQEDIFWEELATRLARRDLLKTNPASSSVELSEEEWFSAMIEAEEKWIKEFEEFGLDRISVNQSFKDVIH
jgi:hypothetical protein